MLNLLGTEDEDTSGTWKDKDKRAGVKMWIGNERLETSAFGKEKGETSKGQSLYISIKPVKMKIIESFDHMKSSCNSANPTK